MKSKTSKQVITLLCIVALTVAMISVVIVREYQEEQKSAVQARQEQETIADTYIRANYAFRFTNAPRYETDYRERAGAFVPLDVTEDYNHFGVYYQLYLTLAYYEKMTGIVLEYQRVVDYLSEQYEPDGALRLYNNGLHPEIEAFVDWMWQCGEEQYDNMTAQEMFAIAPGHQASGTLVELEAYINSVRDTYSNYWFEHRDEGFEQKSFSELSPQMYDELVRKEADPEYEMDLLSLQQQGY